MGHFYTFNFQRKQRRRLLIFILILISLAFFIYIGTNSLFQSQTKTAALVKGDLDKKAIALTFNISWGEEKVYEILKSLEEQKVRATFFVSGEWAERHPQIVDEITEHGHELGMLGYRYKNYLEQEISQVRKDILYAKEVFRKLGYENIDYIRPPSGIFNEEIVDLAKSLELDVVHWSIASKDWENPGVEAIVNEVLNAEKGDIILFHASDVAKQTADALETIIPHFTSKNYSFVTISELKDGATAEESLVE